MYREIETMVEKIIFENEQIQILKTTSGAKKALLYRDLCARANEGDKLIVNYTASLLKLGTGGYDIVKHVLEKQPFHSDSDGHIMKLRYTPQQLSVLSVEAEESPYHSLFTDKFSLNGRYVLLAELHSMIPVVFQLLKQFRKRFTFTVIIDDEASLPLSLSEHMRILQKNENFHSITIGQAFGGQFEAVNLHTALQFAYEQLQSDYVVISLGPGVVGTGSLYGFSGMVLADWANIIGSFHGIPIWVPRISFKDKRERHFGISHHTITPLKQFTYAKSILPLPHLGEWNKTLLNEVKDLQNKHHILLYWENIDELLLKKALDTYPIPIKTMGRTYQDDPHFFYGIYSAVQWLFSHS